MEAVIAELADMSKCCLSRMAAGICVSRLSLLMWVAGVCYSLVAPEIYPYEVMAGFPEYYTGDDTRG